MSKCADLAAENLRLRMIMQRDTLDIARWRERALIAQQLLIKAQPFMNEDEKWMARYKKEIDYAE